MKTADEYASIAKSLDEYRTLLDTIPDDLFTVTPPMGGWSYAEVYSHIIQATLYSTINLEKCTIGNCRVTTKGPSLMGKFVLLFNSFPPFKLKIPKALTDKTTPAKISKEEARNLLIRCHKRVDGLLAPLRAASKNSRMQHPRMGMLNATQWFKFIRIHLTHHLKQIQRIKNNFERA